MDPSIPIDSTAPKAASPQIVVGVAAGSVGSPDLLAVSALWKSNSQTLGFFPDSALIEYARKGWLLVAKDSMHQNQPSGATDDLVSTHLIKSNASL